ncbi:PP2C family protein-serine/threonine phosphatase [Streptomyces pacificus]|uniref:Phosphatase n=1 Tax=Streptomyces pacificus TaxID=2705029 RepID=A0A6A0AN81_9ACTN|nr:PP2C family serine/threonine-protein phosphatase [Streptomyces pacificus]GFH34058.1 phosphatase [Streptomyces pacificus]
MTPQIPQQAACSKCPGCEEPFESGDLFCGACGYDLSAVPRPPRERPAVASGTRVDWPEAPLVSEAGGSGVPATPQRPGELPGTDSGGRELPIAPLRPDRPDALPVSAAAFSPVRQAGSEARFGPAAPGGPVPGVPGPAPACGPGRAPGPGTASAPAPGPGPEPGWSPRSAPAPGPGSGGFQPAAPGPRVGGHPGGGSAGDDGRGSGGHPGGYAAGHPGTGPAAPPLPTQPCVACRADRVDPDGYCGHCGHAQPRERDHMERELSGVAAVSDRGLRHHRNEDSFAVSSTTLPDGSPAVIAIVCDGVSSATRPDEASLAAAGSAGEYLLESLPRGTHPQQAMHEAILAAASAVDSLAAGPGTAMEHGPHRHRNPPACTLAGAVAAGELLVVGWVGDSRAYWIPDDRSGPPARLTEDDSWAAQMVSAGLMSEAEAYADERAHAITGWLGADACELEPHTAAFKPDRPGVVVVCTDGLWNYAEAPREMARVLPPDAASRPLHGARVLVGHALDGGGHDNVTVAVLPFAMRRRGAGSA